MNCIIKYITALILLLSVLPNGISAQSTDGVTTFILVRHAEKVDDSTDPELSAEGTERVQRLAEMLSYTKVDAVYSTSFIRTRETAAPLAEKNGIKVMEYDHRTPEEAAARWRGMHRGETVLISGHSNSTPVFANALLGREHFPDKFDESDYGNLLIITLPDSGEAKLLHLRY